MDLWVTLKDILTEFTTVFFGRQFLADFGVVRDVALFRLSDESGTFLRAKINFNLSKGLFGRREVIERHGKSFWVKILYEGLPRLYFNCGVPDHVQGDCTAPIEINFGPPLRGSWMFQRRREVYRQSGNAILIPPPRSGTVFVRRVRRKVVSRHRGRRLLAVDGEAGVSSDSRPIHLDGDLSPIRSDHRPGKEPMGSVASPPPPVQRRRSSIVIGDLAGEEKEEAARAALSLEIDVGLEAFLQDGLLEASVQPLCGGDPAFTGEGDRGGTAAVPEPEAPPDDYESDLELSNDDGLEIITDGPMEVIEAHEKLHDEEVAASLNRAAKGP